MGAAEVIAQAFWQKAQAGSRPFLLLETNTFSFSFATVSNLLLSTTWADTWRIGTEVDPGKRLPLQDACPIFSPHRVLFLWLAPCVHKQTFYHLKTILQLRGFIPDSAVAATPGYGGVLRMAGASGGEQLQCFRLTPFPARSAFSGCAAVGGAKDRRG